MTRGRSFELLWPLSVAFKLKPERRPPQLRNLTKCFGESPEQEPPTEQDLAPLRAKLAAQLGVSAAAGGKHHPNSTWRFGLVRKLQERAGDRDKWVADWLEHGAPTGVMCPIPHGFGAYPILDSPATLSPSEALDLPVVPNHKSFTDAGQFNAPPGLAIVQQHLASGFGELYRNRADAEKRLGTRISTAPLGCVSKQKETGAWKHRVIMDLRMNGVNATSATPERQVLSTMFDHGRDLALLAAEQVRAAREGEIVSTMVLDFENAFMTIPLAPPRTSLQHLRN